MTGRRTTKDRQMKRDTALLEFWRDHKCNECARFRREYYDTDGFHKSYCVKVSREIEAERPARQCFCFPQPQEKAKSMWQRRQFLRQQQKTPLAGYWQGKLGEMGKAKPIIVKIGECRWCHREFVYSVTNEADVAFYCRDAHRFRYKAFLKEGEKNAQVHRNYPSSDAERAREQNSPPNVFSFGISWGAQPAAGTISIMEIITPTLITYFKSTKSLARYCFLFVVDEWGRCLHSVFVASND